MTQTDRERLIGELCRRYSVGPRFTSTYLEYWESSQGRTFSSLEEVLAMDAQHVAWFEHAMSTNRRDRDVLRSLVPLLPDAGTMLRIGCDFGGFLVAGAEQGWAMHGVEVDPLMLRFTRDNCADHDLQCPLQADLQQLTGAAGTFDAAVCLDVCQLSADPIADLQQLVTLLRPQGVLLLRVPNPSSPALVAADPFSQLFALTLLDRVDAEEYHQQLCGYCLACGELPTLFTYLEAFERLGWSARPSAAETSVVRSLPEMRQLVDTLLQRFLEFSHRQRASVSGRLATKIETHLRIYLGTLVEDLAELSAGAVHEDFRRKYLHDFFLLEARRAGEESLR